jgi:hypothetical protein
MKTDESEKLDDAIASAIDTLRGFEPGQRGGPHLTEAQSIEIAMRTLDTALANYRTAIRH